MPTRRLPDFRHDPTVRKGPIKFSKRVLDRIKAAGRLCGSIESLKAHAVAGFRERFAVELQGAETVPDLTLALDLVGRSVQSAIDRLTEADNVYCGQGVRRKNLSSACRHVAQHEVYPELVDVRRAIDARFGREAGRGVHGMEGKTRRDAKAQHDQLEYLVLALRQRPRLPPALRPGPAGEREHWLKQLEPGYRRLTEMLEELQQMELREAALRNDRDFELESFDVDYAEALAFVRSVCQLGGCGKKVVWHLLPNVQRRRLKRKARKEGEARDRRRETAGSA